MRRNKTVHGYDAIMACSSEANPQVQAFIWHHNGSQLRVNSTKCVMVNTRDTDDITTAGTLTITNAQRSDYGTYKCEATTGVGSDIGVINFTLSCE